MSAAQHLLIVWIVMTIFGVGGMIAALIWAIRTRQFSQQDRARHLPLESGIPPEQEDDDA